MTTAALTPVADGCRISSRLDGPAGAPVLVLSNSLGADAGMWAPQFEALAARFRVRRYDGRGHGASDAPPGPCSIERLGRDVLELLDARGLGRVHFCGLSLGGMVGQWLGAHAPERVDRLVLANTAAYMGPASAWRQRIDAVTRGGMGAVADGVLERWFTPAFRERAPAAVARARAMLLATEPVGKPPDRAPNRPWRTEGLPNGGEGKPPEKGRNWWALAARAFVVYLIVFGLLTLQDRLNDPPAVAYSEFDRQVQAGNVAELFARGQSIQGKLREAKPLPDDKGGRTYDRFATERPVFAQDDLLAKLVQSGAAVKATPVIQERGTLTNLLLSVAPIVLLVLFYRWVFKRQQAAMGGVGGLGGLLGGGAQRKPVDPETVRVTFDDVAGIDEVKGEITEIVDYLRAPEKYRAVGARAPKGVLLTGGPGTGKTLLARATAGEAKVPFFSASASEFIEMIVGVGAGRVRELFQAARAVAPAIIFIDEIDTIGRARGGSRAMGGHDEREQTLNQILTEMDGFSGSEGVIVLAATNRPDVLDPALLRPGRFDRSITVHAPDQAGRRAILGVHARKVTLGPDADLDRVARATPGMTGAELANLVNEAALVAVRRGHEAVGAADLADALERVQLGAARNVVIPPEERRRTAYHEAGHALLGMLQPGADPVRKVSIIPRGRALGVTLSTPDQDRYGYDAGYLKGRMIGALGGMAAEHVVFGVVTTGSESDLQACTGVARSMIGRWGMSERIGPVSIFPPEGDPRALGVSEGTLDAVAEEVRRLVDECYRQAVALLRENRHRLDAIVAELLEHETLDETAVYVAAGLPREHASADRHAEASRRAARAPERPASTPQQRSG